ncbi:hypothetical protein QWJ34_15980 [Saccharibacillus sp. CPCC 101409]|uniref:hypothetical protein n=1 Tax=Saccharibacillus sp. CPCC 101409 TaxID=3058041 RepID=UPI002671DD0F|nr:hypothetical protein [Saccharibacillus sp. CPCC 101409]MDO3411265.1 hypothetical protein [Saccharibacillus sp. CPCC 101409]
MNANKPEANRPEWYKRAQDGPFEREPFTEEMMRRVERSAASGAEAPREKAGRPAGSGRGGHNARLASAAALILLLGGSGAYAASHWSQWRPEVPAASGVSQPASGRHFEEVVPPAGTSTFPLGGRTYFFDDAYARIPEWTRAVRTAAGIVWTPAPQMSGTANTIHDMKMDDHPETSFKLYLSGPDKQELSEEESLKLLELPLTTLGNPDGYPYIDDLWAAGRYVVYTTSIHVKGAPQRKDEKVWVVDTEGLPTTRQDGTLLDVRAITDYRSAGGETFELAYDADNQRLLYYRQSYDTEQAGRTGEAGGEAAAYDLDSGGSFYLDDYGMNYAVRPDGSRTVDYKTDGATYTATILND